jgi:hypothetical protein
VKPRLAALGLALLLAAPLVAETPSPDRFESLGIPVRVGGLILRFDPNQPDRGIEVIGKPSSTEEYLWQFDLGKDGKLYACTYPQAKLVSFDPKTGAMADLGRMHPTEMYARSLAVGPNGKVYVGIGTEKGDLVVFDPATKEHRSLIPPGLRGSAGWKTVGVSRRSDGNVYAEFGTNLTRLDDETVARVAAAPERPPMKLRDGRGSLPGKAPAPVPFHRPPMDPAQAEPGRAGGRLAQRSQRAHLS